MATTGPVPTGRTAQRLRWQFLPRHVRDLVADRCGSPVVEAVSQGGGFTPGFASVLSCADGSRHFVKAASVQAQATFADSYRQEARKLAALPAEVSAPRLLWSHDDDWVVLGLEYVEGRPPRRPWRPDELTRCLETVGATSRLLTPAPAALALDSFADEFAPLVSAWADVRRDRPDLPHVDEAESLAARYAEVTAGATLVHTDIRDDNLLLGADGKVWICDWNWPVVGAAWLATVFVLLAPRGDGIDVDALLSQLPLTRDVPGESIDVVLALVCGYFLHESRQPGPLTSPYLRAHQAWTGEATWAWLSERRGWS